LGLQSISTFKEFKMSSRFYPITGSALLLAALFNVTPVNAADTKPLVPETCVAIKRVASAGHPGKSIQLPRRTKETTSECSRPARARLVLASYVDTAGGKALVMGRTERAIEQIHAKGDVRKSSLALTNLCVAHTVLRQWTEARDSCDAAVAIATANRTRLMYRPGVSRTQLDTAASVAYSNRAVLNWLSRESLAAQNDLARAREISPKAFYVTRNERLSVDASTLAQATAHVDVIG
jgi:hypothetical protein